MMVDFDWGYDVLNVYLQKKFSEPTSPKEILEIKVPAGKLSHTPTGTTNTTTLNKNKEGSLF